ncbi:glutamine-hydrolyzing carbamoyl-phosphate synthase small subunit [Salinisphaera sp. USBA-960]|uniref:glutamine-hydrolyzing carbamoyl-phosphate synthase small subunit n=1 Tax=Salinisphaera orenii TaxID=856731 RepID=UPI000DBE6EBF|nr:glutamine-hydrolyzing carbamoyl-phosphate synthase small subunit [Salifodinibacter halophilus]NNC25519.1 glutamine-hydrolyzing carbamoyl-phosphate synthase small subunit [Salifodinibacter halophilus]
MRPTALLALEDGSLFYGRAIGAEGSTVGEVVFNTAMTGYQEILTDPSYRQQLVTLTYPHVGNTGTNEEDVESGAVQAAGLILRECPRNPSNWRNQSPLGTYLADNNTVGIGGLDTRALTNLLRDKGAQNGCIVAGGDLDSDDALAKACAFPGLKGADLAADAGTATAYEWTVPSWQGPGLPAAERTAPAFHVAVYDYGVKYNILRCLIDVGARVTVVPPRQSLDETLALGVDGVVLANGPGDPDPCDYAIETARELIEREVPTFGICLGHQILSLAVGATSHKMKFGHHGANHPVVEIASGDVMISSQNHGFAIDEASLPDGVRATHRSLFDGTLQGIELVDKPVFSFQGHPEASPGPHDVAPLFQRFVRTMQANSPSMSAHESL